MQTKQHLVYKFFHVIMLWLIVSIELTNAATLIYADGDLAPRGQPDGVINAADYLVAMQIVLQRITPTADEIKHGDLYPVVGGDGQITLSDVMQLIKLVLN